jgi:hypothetical protein
MTCKDATRLMVDEHLNDANLLTRIWARAHCLMCPHCRRYAAHLRGIGVYGGARIYPSLQDTDSSIHLEPQVARMLNNRWARDAATNTASDAPPRH